MTLPPTPDRWTVALAQAERLAAVAAFGFTERQARFVVTVLLHAGVFVERQYCAAAGIVHGQTSTDFVRTLVARRYATPITIGTLHRGRLFHLHFKPLWAAIGEPDSRFRKPASPGRLIERVMLLDAVLDEPERTWLGPALDKRRYFMRDLRDIPANEHPVLRFGEGASTTVRVFPDKLPIGISSDAHTVLLYLVTQPSPMDFRGFLLRHSGLLRALPRWTIRVLFPRPLRTARSAYQHAAREHLATPLAPSSTEELEWYFAERRRRAGGSPAPLDPRFRQAVSTYGAPRFQALYRQWLHDPANTFWMAASPRLPDTLALGHGTVECVELTRQYLHLSPLVDVA